MLHIVIPTRNRVKKLKKTLETIPQGEDIQVHIGIDGASTDRETENFVDTTHHIKYVSPEHVGSVALRNKIIQEIINKDVAEGNNLSESFLLYATDDITFHYRSIDLAHKIMPSVVGDTGILGFTQHVIGCKNEKDWNVVGVGMVSLKFISNFPNNQLFCPEYYHFSVQELEWYCKAKGYKIHVSKDIALDHFHPSFNPDIIDKTHKEARKNKQKDFSLMHHRKVNHLIWGITNDNEN